MAKQDDFYFSDVSFLPYHCVPLQLNVNSFVHILSGVFRGVGRKRRPGTTSTAEAKGRGSRLGDGERWHRNNGQETVCDPLSHLSSQSRWSARPHPKHFPGLNDMVPVSVTLLEAIVVINIVNFLHSGRRTCQGSEAPGRLVHWKIVVQEIDVRRLIRTTLATGWIKTS